MNREPLVDHSYSQDTPVTVAIVTAFLKSGKNIGEDERRLFDFVDPDALETLAHESEVPTTITTQLWGHPVLIDSESIQIFEKTNT